MRYYARKRVAKKNEYGDSSQAIEEYEKKMWENFAEIPLEIIRQSIVNQTVYTRKRYLFTLAPKKKRQSRQKITQKNCALFRGPKTQKKCSIFTLKNYALLTEFHPPLEFPLSLTRQTIPKMGLHRGKTLPYHTIMYRTTSVSLFAAQLNCRRSWVILETDPQFLPLSFHRFFHKEIAGKCILFFSGFFFSFL